MSSRLSKQFRQHPWLATAVCLYLLLSAAELTRILLVADRLDKYDTGFSSWREARVGEEQAIMVFRWTGPHSTLVRPVEGEALRLLLYNDQPQIPPGGTRVTFTMNGQPLDATVLAQNGLYWFQWYLPPILGMEAWADVEPILAQRARTEQAAAADGWFSSWQELKPWRRPPRAPAVRIETTVEAAQPLGADVDSRTGLGIATLEWLDEIPADGIGFHERVTDASGKEFRWTRRWASLPLQASASQVRVSLLAIHPDIREEPVRVDFFWNGELRHSASLAEPEWTDVAVPMAPSANRDGVLTIRVDRTWSPLRAGIGEDRRELGVAVERVTWRD